MKAREKIIPAFLTGGGEMGELIRSFDWSKTAVGSPDTWPQSLRIAVRIMLDTPFGMYIAWGNEYIQLYNDGYRPILGATKHPQALGISTRKTFAEIWPTIGPMFEGVMQGTPVGFPDFILQLDRNGFLEECVFDFSYSPIRLEDGEVGGVLVTVIETTEKVKAAKALKESEQELQFAIEATELGTWDLNAATNKFRGNSRLKEWFGLKPDEEIELPLALAVIADKDRDKVTAAIQTTLQFSSGGHYDIIYTIIHPQTKNERIVRARGQASFNDEGIAYRFNGTLQDVTKEIVARALLTESEQRFRTLTETVPHMIWTARPDGKKNFFNKYFLEYTGLSFEELKGDGWQKIIFPDDLERELAQWHHHIKTGEDFKIEKRLRHHNGTYRWQLSHSIPQKNAEGKITGWIGTNTDITEQKSFAEELEEKVKERTYQLHIQNETFKQAEESSMQGSYSFNLTTGKLSYSDNLYRLIGYKPNEFEPSLEEFNKHVHPEDRDYVTQAAEKVLASKTADAWHYRMNTKNGQVINIKGTGRVIESGDEKLLVGTLQDVTKEFELNKELQEKEEYSMQIINNAPDAVIVIDEKSIITLWNPKTEEIFGWKAEEVLGLHFTDTIIPRQYREGMKRLLKTGEAHILNKTLELTALNKEGKEFPISIKISHATQQGNKLFIAFLRDITLEKRTKELAISNQSLLKANTELEASQKLSEKLLKQRDEFISIASHEMKTPVTITKGYLQLLELALPPDNTPAQLYARKASEGLAKLNELITDLLDVSKVQNGKLNYNISTFNFNEMIAATVEDLQHSSPEHIIIKTGNVHQPVTGDKDRLQQVVINLLNNAIKYSPGESNVYINIDQSDGEVKVSIKDHGIGISKHNLEKIFDRYYRVDDHAVNIPGLGIGLFISYEIIQRHQGKLWVESEPGKGSTFYFTLPVNNN